MTKRQKKDVDTTLLNRRRQEKQLDDLLRVARDTNKMLRGERSARKVKMIIVLLALLSLAGYGYYLFEKHKIKIIEFQQRVEELQRHLQEAENLVQKFGETAGSIRGIFESVSDSDNADTTETTE